MNNPEKQSLFVGIADPRSIECIYYKNSDRKWIAHDRLDFIEYAKSSLKEDPEYVLTLKDTDTWETLVNRLYKFEMDYDIGIILKGLNNAKTFEKQIAVLSPSGYGGGTVYAPYSSAKKIVLELQRQGTIPKAKSTNTKQVYDESYLNSVGPTGKAYIT